MALTTRHRTVIIACAVVAALSITGCGKQQSSARELRERYALAMLDGFSVGYWTVKADSVDPKTLDLLNLTLEDGQRILHADRAEILINEANGTAALRLIGLVGADPETGSLIALDELTTDPTPVPVTSAND
jgi:hypothetical protein